MANVKITDLTAYTDAASTDVLPLVDVSNNVTKKISIADLLKASPLGSAAAPGIAFDGDPNTGVYSPGADQVAISTNGSGRLFVDADGRVRLVSTGLGINKTSQNGFDLDVNGLSILRGTTYTDAINGITGDTTITSPASQSLIFKRSNTEVGRFDSSGRLGIGVSAPSRLFHLEQADAAPLARLAYNGTYYSEIDYLGSINTVTPASTDLWQLKRNGTAQVSLDGSGRLGIGTTPAYTLDVAGSSTAARIGKLNILDDSPFVTGANLAASSTFALGTQTAHSTIFFTNNTERLRITSAGLVGIGTSSPSTILHVNTSVNNSSDYYLDAGATALIRNDNASGVTSLRLASSSNSTSALVWGGSGSETLIFANRQNERLRIDSSGRVGIGTTSADQVLSVQGLISTKAPDGATRGLVGSPSWDASYFAVQNGTLAQSAANAALYQNSVGITTLNSASGYPLTFAIGQGEKARLDSSGRLLMGTSSSSASAAAVLQGFAGSSTGQGILQLQVGKNTAATGINENLGSVRFANSDGNIGAWISGEADLQWNSGDYPSRLVFSTTADGASSPTERMRIGSSGNIGIGVADEATIKLYSVATGSQYAGYFTFAGATGQGIGIRSTGASTAYPIYFFNNGTLVGSVYTTSSSTSYNTSSDYRLKENVTAVTDGITRLQQLKPSRFNFLADPTKTVDGFIAHEVQTVVPEAITGEKDAVDDDGNPVYQGIDQSKLVPLLTAALQEAVARIEQLEAAVATLQGS